MAKRKPDWQLITIYLTITGTLVTLFFYIADMKERTKALEIQFGHEKRLQALEEKLK